MIWSNLLPLAENCAREGNQCRKQVIAQAFVLVLEYQTFKRHLEKKWRVFNLILSWAGNQGWEENTSLPRSWWHDVGRSEAFQGSISQDQAGRLAQHPEETQGRQAWLACLPVGARGWISHLKHGEMAVRQQLLEPLLKVFQLEESHSNCAVCWVADGVWEQGWRRQQCVSALFPKLILSVNPQTVASPRFFQFM